MRDNRHTVRPRVLFALLVASGGVVALVVGTTVGVVTSMLTGVLALATALLLERERALGSDIPDPSRRRLLALTGG
ncbi:MAG: hypothetical protein ACRDG2_08100, partial [Actinomycetota bacterium]